jgi:hypothetical protein
VLFRSRAGWLTPDFASLHPGYEPSGRRRITLR